MKSSKTSIVEREFILNCIRNSKRLDGRQAYDFRHIKVSFGKDRGCCEVQLGDTRVLSQVSCDIIQPRQNRPTEGTMYFNVELSPMASPTFELGRQSEFAVELIRLLEKTVRDSRAIDTESLCIIAGEKVWEIRVDVHVLNHDGNIVDCVTMAAISALSHFRRPDVSVVGEEVQVHSPDDHDPVPLSVHHLPVSVTFAYFDQGKHLLVDPTDKEERVMDGNMIISMNIHREICSVQMSGDMLLVKDQILRCTQISVVKVAEIVDVIKQALANDSKARASGDKFGFAESFAKEKITTFHRGEMEVEMISNGKQSHEEESEKVNSGDVMSEVMLLGEGTAAIGEGGKNTWFTDETAKPITAKKRKDGKSKKKKKQKKESVAESGSEEEETVVLLQDDL
ncbi:exosome complex component RRP45-like isoform X2 [Ptychodera flava]|uniref:exosome complex component RRP45-like isoform X2 n=1 Tax=Ptychodera flava TaxID=63121 RepID=UPI00396AA573